MDAADNTTLAHQIDIHPVRHPRDIIDVATQVGSFAVWLVLVFLSAVPGYVLGETLGRSWDPWYITVLVVLPPSVWMFGPLVLVWLKGGVRLTLDGSGVWVRTVWNGRRCFAHWREVTRIQAVARREAALVAAFRFWKILGGGLTSRDVHAIEAGNRWIMIAPRDRPLFLRAVRQWWPGPTTANPGMPNVVPLPARRRDRKSLSVAEVRPSGS
jgi:hypothetical protein